MSKHPHHNVIRTKMVLHDAVDAEYMATLLRDSEESKRMEELPMYGIRVTELVMEKIEEEINYA